MISPKHESGIGRAEKNSVMLGSRVNHASLRVYTAFSHVPAGPRAKKGSKERHWVSCRFELLNNYIPNKHIPHLGLDKSGEEKCPLKAAAGPGKNAFVQ